MKTIYKLTLILFISGMSMSAFSQTYTMPHENDPHEGTWLQWPHQFEYGVAYRNSLDATWVAMTQALVGGEKVHIVAYNNTEKNRIITLLTAASVPLTNVDFYIFQTNDVWVRDNGPIFVKDSGGNIKIEDWGFNGWGGDYNYNLCNPIPTSVGTAIGMPVINLNSIMVNEGGAVELDGNGVLLACKSSILEQVVTNAIRNPGMTQAAAEVIFAQYLGVTKFIWLNGAFTPGEVTDFHIDGFAKFVDDSIMVTMNNTDLTYWGASAADIATLYSASNVANQTYTKVYLPLTQSDVVTTSSVNLGYKGSYANYYVANGVVLVPNYSDPNDVIANGIIQTLYPGRTVIGIDCRNLYENGGMVHCVTQQQPAPSTTTGFYESNINESGITMEQNFPNPSNGYTSITLSLVNDADCIIEIYNSTGQVVTKLIEKHLVEGKHNFTFNIESLPAGIYNYVLKVNGQITISRKMVIMK